MYPSILFSCDSFPAVPLIENLAEKITFDEVENEHTTTPAAERKRAPLRKKRGADDTSADARKTKSAKSSAIGKQRKGAATTPAAKAESAAASVDETKKKKSHYPDIKFDTNKIASFIKAKGKKSHAELLDKIVVDVCQAEAVGLEKFFKEISSSGVGKGKADLLRVMKTVLDELPGEITGECPLDVQFEPEFKEGEKDEVGVLSNVLARLREQSDALSKYDGNMKRLATDYDLWFEGPSEVVTDRIGDMAMEKKDNAKEAVNVKEVVKDYGSILDEISEYCDSILEETKAASAVETRAESLQDSLFKGYQSVRFEAKGGANLPEADPKSLVKGLQKK